MFANEIRELFNIQPAALTAAEAGYIIGFRDADTLRNRAVKAGSERSERLRSKGIRTSEADSVISAGSVKEADHAQYSLFDQADQKGTDRVSAGVRQAAVQWYANKALPGSVRNISNEVGFTQTGTFKATTRAVRRASDFAAAVEKIQKVPPLCRHALIYIFKRSTRFKGLRLIRLVPLTSQHLP